jgi:hypothetical protein
VGGIAPILNPDGTPYGMMTSRSLFQYINRLVGPLTQHREMHLDDILDLPCQEAVDVHVPKVQANARIRDVLNRLLREEGDESWNLPAT